MALDIVPLTLKAANAFVAVHHRHHKPVIGHKFSIGLESAGAIVGCCIVSRPTARMSDDGRTCEVLRLCTDGTRNACSMLYRAAWRCAKEMGYRRLLTYTLPEEGGASLRAAGFVRIGEAGGGSWSRALRPRDDKHPLQRKVRWELREAEYGNAKE
jgi:hypothetical protein